MKIAYPVLLQPTLMETVRPESRRCLRRIFSRARHSRNTAAPFVSLAERVGRALIGAPSHARSRRNNHRVGACALRVREVQLAFLCSQGTKRLHLIAMKTKRLILFALATVRRSQRRSRQTFLKLTASAGESRHDRAGRNLRDVGYFLVG